MFDECSQIVPFLSGYSVYFAAIKTKLPRGPTEVPDKPSFRGFRVAYALECLLSRGFKVRDRLSRVFYDILRQTGATNDYYHVLKSGEFTTEKLFYHYSLGDLRAEDRRGIWTTPQFFGSYIWPIAIKVLTCEAIV